MTSPLPSRRKKERLGVRDSQVFRSDRHLKFIRSLECVVKDCTNKGRIVAAHIRAGLPPGEMGGTSLKPGDCWTFPSCNDHHFEEHEGTKSFQRKYRLDLVKIAYGLALTSKCPLTQQKARGIQL